MNNVDLTYHELLKDIINNGIDKIDRTNVGTKSVFGRMIRFDMREGFPLLTTKKIHVKSVIHELLWFLKGDTNIKYLNDNNVKVRITGPRNEIKGIDLDIYRAMGMKIDTFFDELILEEGKQIDFSDKNTILLEIANFFTNSIISL